MKPRPLTALLITLLFAGAAAPPPAANSLGITLIPIPAGTFTMGADPDPIPKSLLAGVHAIQYDRPSPEGDYDEHPAHQVTISKPFLISATEITIDQYRQFKPDYQPSPYWAPYAAGISWHDAVAFCQWLSKKEGKPYRLPTEAEWEYVARAGTRTFFSNATTQPSPKDAPNPWGVQNMNNVVAEWTLDWHAPYPASAQTDPVGPATGLAKVVRGGGLDYRKAPNDDHGHILPAELPYYRRSANRASISPDFASPLGNIGFRVVQADLPATAPTPVEPLFFQTALRQSAPDLSTGPDPSKPWFHSRPLFPNLGDRNMRTVGWKLGLAPALGAAYHNSALQVCPNGDLVAAYYNTLQYENDPDQTILVMRLRFGSDEWDMPEPFPDFADSADAAPIFWNDPVSQKLWLFWGNPRLLGGPPFQFITSPDSGATWSTPHMALLSPFADNFTNQPINAVLRDKSNTLYVPVDGKGATSVLFASRDEGQTWHDTGGRTGGRHTTLVLAKDGSLLGFGGKDSNIDGFMPISRSVDGGKTWTTSKSPFPPLASGQRPSVIRLASGRLFFVSDSPPRGTGSFAALSDDDGLTWKQRPLPVNTVGYVTATQAPNGLIHIVTSKTKPAPLHLELNEAWILSSEDPAPITPAFTAPDPYTETYPNGKTRLSYALARGADHQLHLDGPFTCLSDTGRKCYEASFSHGQKTAETLYTPDGHKRWDRTRAPDGTITWRLYDAAGKLTATSTWKSKDLLDATFQQ